MGEDGPYALHPDTGPTPCLPFSGRPGQATRQALPAAQARPGLLGSVGHEPSWAIPCLSRVLRVALLGKMIQRGSRENANKV
jgi:hypothetical protein